MGAVTFGIPKELVLLLRDIYSIKVFVETGTYKGDSAIWAAKNFEKVITIENSAAIYNSTVKKISKYQNIEFLLGNSAELLPGILEITDMPVLFWLDAHWCGGETFGKNFECPLLDEVLSIVKHPYNHIVLIDDARFFLKPPPFFHAYSQWPGLNEILRVFSVKPDYYSFVSEDVIGSIPGIGKESLIPYFNKVHKNEFPGQGVIKNLRFAFRNILRKRNLIK